MIDRHGKHVRVSLSEVEIEWIKAANSLGETERQYALMDIASMSGRVFANVYKQAGRMRADVRKQGRVVLSGIRISRATVVPREAQRVNIKHLRKPGACPQACAASPARDSTNRITVYAD